jgi:hypothetical protein
LFEALPVIRKRPVGHDTQVLHEARQTDSDMPRGDPVFGLRRGTAKQIRFKVD